MVLLHGKKSLGRVMPSTYETELVVGLIICDTYTKTLRG